MKKFISTMASILIVFFAMAQVPDIMNYQAVARNAAGQALANQSIKVRLSVVKNAVTQYSETRQVTTNTLGLFNVQIGSAGALSTIGNFANINWQNNAAPGYALKVELDINNTNVFTDMGNQALVTVPYSFAAKEAIEADNANKIGGNAVAVATPAANDLLKWNGTAWMPAAGPKVYPIATLGIQIEAGGGSAPWAFVSSNTNQPTVTLAAGQKLVSTFMASASHVHASSANNYYYDVDICYQPIGGGTIYSIGSGFYPSYSGPIVNNASKFHIAASAGADVVAGAALGTRNTIPPGTYKIYLAIKNKSILNPNAILVEYVNGFVQVL